MIIYGKLSLSLQNYIIPEQHGTIAKRSTLSNLLIFNEFIAESLVDETEILVIYTDFQKAFDKVNHKLLIHKLSKYGFVGNILSWLLSYVTDRVHTICENKNYISQPIFPSSGLPQRSHLSAPLFNIFINDIKMCIESSNFLLYIDDLKIFRKIESPNDYNYTKNDLLNIESWTIRNNLLFNPFKCKVILYSKKSKKCDKVFYIYNEMLENVTFIKDL